MSVSRKRQSNDKSSRAVVSNLLKKVEFNIEIQQKAGFLGCDPTKDQALHSIQSKASTLEAALNEQEKPRHPSSKWMPPILIDIASLFRSNSRAKRVTRFRFQELEDGLEALEVTSKGRSVKSPLGLYNNLVGRQVITSMTSEKSYDFKGRYEDTGLRLYGIATKLNAVANNRVHSKRGSTQHDEWEYFKNLAAQTINRIIKFMGNAPFRIDVHERAIKMIEREVTQLTQVYFDDPEILSNIKHVIERELADITRYIQSEEDQYELLIKNYVKPGMTPAEERVLLHYGLQEGQLKETELVMNIMNAESNSETKGCGIPIICSGKADTIEKREGGYCDVYKAQVPESLRSDFGEVVAVKVLKNTHDSIAMTNLRMFREAYSWSKSRLYPEDRGCQYLAPLLGIWDGVANGRPGLISLWCDEDHIKAYLRQKRPITPTRLTLLIQIAEGMNYLHSCGEGIIHGDLKPTNILMHDDKPLIADFGLAKCLDDKKPAFTSKSCPYTDYFRAPELEYREVSLMPYPTKASDVYAFGCVMFEVLSEKDLYEGFSHETVREWIRAEEDKTPLEVEEEREGGQRYRFEPLHEQLMKKCFKFHASKRPDFKTVLEDLERSQKFPCAIEPPIPPS